uniref:Uncharacterized protein n=1 Tax=Acrobeloides nanus TaxID=290746 RepID=A0A914EH26_9BILA
MTSSAEKKPTKGCIRLSIKPIPSSNLSDPPCPSAKMSLQHNSRSTARLGTLSFLSSISQSSPASPLVDLIQIQTDRFNEPHEN